MDPDTVFFPARLKVAVAFHPDTYNGLYLNNCKLGLHGPLEVLSSRAVSRWHEGIGNCHHHFNTVCSGPCRWGEDALSLPACPPGSPDPASRLTPESAAAESSRGAPFR